MLGVKFGVKFNKQRFGAWYGCYARIRCKDKVQRFGAVRVPCGAGAKQTSKGLAWC